MTTTGTRDKYAGQPQVRAHRRGNRLSLDDLFRTDSPADHGGREDDLFGLGDDLFDFGDLPLEENSEFARDVAQTSFDTESSDLSLDLGAKIKPTRERKLDRLTHEDFEEGAPRKAAIIIIHYASQLFPDILAKRGRKPKLKSTPAELREAIDFVFGHASADEMNFNLCCRAIGARRDILRIRFHYEFWLRRMVFPNPFPFLTDPLPEILENEAMIVASWSSVDLLREAWVQPGILTSDLIERVGGDRSKRAAELQRLERSRLMSRFVDHWYATGRNPALDTLECGKAARLCWAKLW